MNATQLNLLIATKAGSVAHVESELKLLSPADLQQVALDDSFYSIFQVALRTSNSHQIIECFLKSFKDSGVQIDLSAPFYELAHRGEVEFCRLFLDYGFNINSIDQHPTPLMISCINKDPELFDLFLAAGADVDVSFPLTHREYGGRSALYFALRSQNMHYVSALLEAGAKTDIQDHFSSTPLDYAKSIEFHDGAACLMASQESKELSTAVSSVDFGQMIPSRNKLSL